MPHTYTPRPLFRADNGSPGHGSVGRIVGSPGHVLPITSVCLFEHEHIIYHAFMIMNELASRAVPNLMCITYYDTELPTDSSVLLKETVTISSEIRKYETETSQSCHTSIHFSDGEITQTLQEDCRLLMRLRLNVNDTPVHLVK